MGNREQLLSRLRGEEYARPEVIIIFTDESPTPEDLNRPHTIWIE